MNKFSNQKDFFESTTILEKRQRREVKALNKAGNPIKLSSKINAAVVDPASPSSSIYVAVSSGWVQRVDVDSTEPATTAGETPPSSSNTSTIFRGPKAPVTCITLGGPSNSLIFAGSWDRSVWQWSVSERRNPPKTYAGHSDFVKAVACATISNSTSGDDKGKHFMFSGGADRKIIVWDISSGAKLHVLQDISGLMFAVQHLAIDPSSLRLGVNPTTGVNNVAEDYIHLISASSDPALRRWKITPSSATQVVEHSHSPYDPDQAPPEPRDSIQAHETGVYKIIFDTANEDIDLWTSSADGTAKCLSRAKNFAAEETYRHGDYVRSIALTENWVITAGRSEDVKVWDRTTGKLFVSLVGHYDEITDLVVLPGKNREGDRVVSVSIDGTVRTWELGRKALGELKILQEDEEVKRKKEEDDAVKKGKEGGVMTAEEEAELAALMED